MRDLPSGTVTFLFTDIEGSTKLLHKLGSEGYEQALGEHRGILREAFVAQGGVEVTRRGTPSSSPSPPPRARSMRPPRRSKG